MKRIYIFPIVILVLLTSCSMNQSKSEDKSNTNEFEATTSSLVKIQYIESYFAIAKPQRPVGLIMDKEQFNENFSPAKTMSNNITKIDFDTQKVGAIVLPETSHNTVILIDSVHLKGTTLNVDYTVIRDNEKRSFSIVPAKAFTFDSSLNIKSATFIDNSDSIKVYL